MLKWITSKFLQMVYTSRHRPGLLDLNKLVEVTMSCSTPEQCEAGLGYVELYKAKHLASLPEDGFTRSAAMVMEQFTMFLEDTREHAVFGMHHPKYNGGAPVETFPNMNDYVGKVLNVRFKPCWERGVTSIAGPKN